MKRPEIIKRIVQHRINLLNIALSHVDMVGLLDYIDHLERKIESQKERQDYLHGVIKRLRQD